MTRGHAATPDNAEFAALLDAARAGSGSALRRLWEWLNPPVAGYLRSQGVLDSEAATNEVFFRCFDRLDRFAGTGTGFRSWVFTIAHNLVIDERRRAARRPQSRPTADVRKLERRGGDTEAEALARLDLANTGELLGLLTEPQRDVVFLRVIAGLDVAETASVLGRAPGAIKALQHRGLSALRAILAERGVTKPADSTFPTMT